MTNFFAKLTEDDESELGRVDSFCFANPSDGLAMLCENARCFADCEATAQQKYSEHFPDIAREVGEAVVDESGDEFGLPTMDEVEELRAPVGEQVKVVPGKGKWHHKNSAKKKKAKLDRDFDSALQENQVELSVVGHFPDALSLASADVARADVVRSELCDSDGKGVNPVPPPEAQSCLALNVSSRPPVQDGVPINVCQSRPAKAPRVKFGVGGCSGACCSSSHGDSVSSVSDVGVVTGDAVRISISTSLSPYVSGLEVRSSTSIVHSVSGSEGVEAESSTSIVHSVANTESPSENEDVDADGGCSSRGYGRCNALDFCNCGSVRKNTPNLNKSEDADVNGVECLEVAFKSPVFAMKEWQFGSCDLDGLVEAVARRQASLHVKLEWLEEVGAPYGLTEVVREHLRDIGQDKSGSKGLVWTDRPPLTMAGQGGRKCQDGQGQPPEPKPEVDWAKLAAKIEGPVVERLQVLERRAADLRSGRNVVGVVPAVDGRKYARKILQEKGEEFNEADREDQVLKSGVMCFTPEDQVLCAATAWQSEVAGWKCVECILDSGASESVCPPSMAPLWAIEDSPGSKIGLHYLSANGGRIANRGQQRLPIELAGGVRTHAVFQVADVSRPLISVAKLAEAGKAVIFGCSGGVIRDIATGVDTPFERRDGIYIFKMKIPPPDAVRADAGFVRHPWAIALSRARPEATEESRAVRMWWLQFRSSGQD